MATHISILGIDKAALLQALFNNARLHRDATRGIYHKDKARPMTHSEAQTYLKGQRNYYFESIRGRILKVGILSDVMRTDLYNQANGPGMAEQVVMSLRRNAQGVNVPRRVRFEEPIRTETVTVPEPSSFGLDTVKFSDSPEESSSRFRGGGGEFGGGGSSGSWDSGSDSSSSSDYGSSSGGSGDY